MRQAGSPTPAIGLKINPYEYRCEYAPPLALRQAQRLSDYLAPRLITQILQELRSSAPGSLLYRTP